MTSIRGQLLKRLLPPIAILVVVSVTSLHLYVRHVLYKDFDATLTAKAQAVAAGVRWGGPGAADLVSPDAASEEFSHDKHAEYFQIRRADGSNALRSSSLAGMDLPAPAAATEKTAFADLTLPDGRSGREVVIRFVPARDPGGIVPPGAPLNGRMTLSLAQSRHVLDEPLTVLLTSLSIGSLVFVAGAMLIVILAIRRSLQPLMRTAKEAASAPTLAIGQRFAVPGMPGELAPICQYLDELVARLQTAFEREKRFTADVAHELRTPIAELRAITEVALQYPGSAAENSATLRDALAISGHMEAIVTTLLAIARCESGRPQLTSEKIDLAALVRDAWRPLASQAADRGADMTFELPESAVLESNRTLLAAIISNLLSNAASYCAAGGTIACRVESRSDAMVVSVSNTIESFSAEDLSHMFEPFWRKDAARSSGTHSGLGLALSRAYCQALGATLVAELAEPHVLRMTLRLQPPR
jgi:two-component system sensor histidine kinase QseC